MGHEVKSAFLAAGVPEEHHEALHAKGVTPQQIREIAKASGMSVLQVIQALLAAAPEIIALFQKLFPKPTPPVPVG